MKTKALLALVALFCLLINGLAQTPTQTQTQGPPPPPPRFANQGQDKDDDVVKITTNLVQIDAVVTKDGKPVGDLKAEDFEIFEDDRPQTITSFAYISNVPRTTTTTAPVADAADRDPTVPPTPLKPDDPRRTLAIVVDDLGLSAESMNDVRRQLRKFVTEDVQPNDLIAIIRTGADIGALQQFTNDKRLLLRAVDQLRWNIGSRVGINVLPPAYRPAFPGPIGNNFGGYSYHGSLSALRFIIDAMAEFPGRKSLMFLSDSLPVEDQSFEYFLGSGVSGGGEFDAMRRREALRKIAEMAIRASVVIYSIDTQGLQTGGITAADSFSGTNARDVGQRMNAITNARRQMIFDRRGGGDMISRQTGGFQIKNSNDYKLDRVLEDLSGYYLLGYRPTEETFNARFHKITAKVKRSGMTVRTRHGFYGYAEEDTPRVPEPRISAALKSPFGSQDINLDFTSFFANNATAGSYIRSFIFVDAKDLTFETVGNKREAKIELLGIMFGNNGVAVEEIRHVAVVSLTDKDYEQSLRDGIRIRFDIPVKQPNAYQVRVAVRDIGSSRIGAAGKFVFVPDLSKKILAVSGIVLLQGVSETRETGAIQTSVASPAVKRYLPNSEVYATCEIYNASIDPKLKRPNLTIESKLFRDGKRVFTYSKVPVDLTDQPDLSRIQVSLKFRLGADLEPGHYYLQLQVTDEPLKEKLFPASQWADFEIIKPQ